MSRPKILFLIQIPPPVHGSSVVGKQIRESKSINENYDCFYINVGTSRSIKEIGKNPAGKIFRYINIHLKITFNLLIHRPDLCYMAITSNGIGFYKDALIILLIKLFRIKLVYHFHNKGVNKSQGKFVDNLIYKIVFKNTEAILLSPLLYYDVKKYIPENLIHYCPNGIRNIYFEPIISQRKETSILFLSNLICSKGIYVLLDACSLIRKKGIEFKCSFVGSPGDINEEQFNAKLKELKLSENVHYLGKKIGKEKETILQEADILAFPTFYKNETFGLVILEAMQHGLPVVSTFEGGIPDIVDDGVTGFLVPQKDAAALADKLEILILNPALRKSMGRAGREKYEKEFTLETFEFRMKKIFDKLLQKA